MREIKFRGLLVNSEEQKWLYGSLVTGLFHNIKTKENCAIIVDPTGNIDFDCLGDLDDLDLDVDIKTVGQFTGLKDKNGVEIYEGDILQYPNEKCIGVVKFGIFSCLIGGDDWNGGNGFYLDRIDQYNQSGLMDCKNLTIIGNIHQNPELLSHA